MYKFIALAAFFTIAAAAPGLIAEHHHVVETPVVAKVGAIVHSAPSSVSHQSLTQVHSKAHIVAPVVKTVAAPVVHTYSAPAIVKTVHHVPAIVPVVKSVNYVAPVVKSFAPVVPVVKTYAAPVVHHAAISHQSHNQIHHNKAIITPVVVPVVKTFVVAPAVKSVYAAAPVAHIVHH